MNKFMSAVQNRDGNALARMMPAEPQARVVNGNAEKLVDLLFVNLMQVFPAAKQTALSTPAEVAAAKRQWITAFAENGITSVEQLQAGMRMARQQESDFGRAVESSLAGVRLAPPRMLACHRLMRLRRSSSATARIAGSMRGLKISTGRRRLCTGL